MREETCKKVERAIRLLRSVKLHDGEPVEVAYSGGKDSDVILELTRMAGIPYVAIYKNTTIDPPGTIMHAQRAGAIIKRPRRTFRELVIAKGAPSRYARFCCAELKEYYAGHYNVVIGVRRDESRKRAERYKEPVECRVYSKNLRVQQIYPILDWTTEDEKEFVCERKIKLHPLYYREDGSLDLTQRLGCMCCPLQSQRRRREEFRKCPGMMRLYISAVQKFMDAHKDGRIHEYFRGSAVQKMAYETLSRVSVEEFIDRRDFGDEPMAEDDFKRLIRENFGIEALPKDMR